MSVRYPQLVQKAMELKAQGDTQGAKLITDGIKYLADYYAERAKRGLDLSFLDPGKDKSAIAEELKKSEESLAWINGVYELYDEGTEEYEKARAVDAVYNAAGLEDDFDPFDVASDICDQLTTCSIIEHVAIGYGKKNNYSVEGFVWEGDEDLVEFVMEDVQFYLDGLKEKGE